MITQFKILSNIHLIHGKAALNPIIIMIHFCVCSWKERRENLMKHEYPDFVQRLRGTKSLKNLVEKASQGNAWQVDHIIPVYLGGGQCDMINLRTLCTACHQKVTALQSSHRKKERHLTRKRQLQKAQQELDAENKGAKQTKVEIQAKVHDGSGSELTL